MLWVIYLTKSPNSQANPPGRHSQGHNHKQFISSSLGAAELTPKPHHKASLGTRLALHLPSQAPQLFRHFI